VSTDYVQVRIPRSLYERILRYIRSGESKFATPDEYVAFVLNEILGDEPPKEAIYSPEDEAKIQEHLRRLGYL
jgi:hypothetical protein